MASSSSLTDRRHGSSMALRRVCELNRKGSERISTPFTLSARVTTLAVAISTSPAMNDLATVRSGRARAPCRISMATALSGARAAASLSWTRLAPRLLVGGSGADGRKGRGGGAGLGGRSVGEAKQEQPWPQRQAQERASHHADARRLAQQL